MVRQYRKALEKVIVEIPAGKLDHQEEPIALLTSGLYFIRRLVRT